MATIPTISVSGLKPTKYSYLDFQTPQFSISITTPDGTNSVDLPPQLLRLIKKVEIIENWGDKCKHPVVINLVFSEGSREPYGFNQNTTDLYPVSSNISGSLTNNTGFLTDLRFEGQGSNITALITSSALSAISQVAAVATSTNTSNQVLSSAKYPDKSPTYLFQEGNIIVVSWGYDQSSKVPGRKVAAVINVVQADFPEADQPTLSVTATSLNAKLNQLSPLYAQDFYTKLIIGVDPTSGKPLEVFQDMTTQDVVKQIANSLGWNSIVSQTLIAPVLDSHYVKKWITGESLDKFLKKLAAIHNAYYSIVIDPKNLTPTIIFIARVEFEKVTRIQKALFNFKAKGSILKSVSIRADFTSITGSANVGLDNQGNIVQTQSDTGEETAALYQGQGYAAASSVLGNNSSDLTSYGQDTQVVGKANYNPKSNDKTVMKDTSKTSAKCMASKLVSLEFTALGYPVLKAGDTIFIDNIGARYSQYYFINTVTHSIDADGYRISANAQSQNLNGDGTLNDASTPGQDQEQLEDVQFFQPTAALSLPSSVGNSITAFEAYNKLMLG